MSENKQRGNFWNYGKFSSTVAAHEVHICQCMLQKVMLTQHQFATPQVSNRLKT